MADDRTVTVRLKAEIDQYLAAMAQAGAATDALQRAMESASSGQVGQDLEAVAAGAERAAAGQAQLSESSKRSSESVREAGEASKQAAAEVENLAEAAVQGATDTEALAAVAPAFEDAGTEAGVSFQRGLDIPLGQLQLPGLDTALGAEAEDAAQRGREAGDNFREGFDEGAAPAATDWVQDELPLFEPPAGDGGKRAGKTFADNFKSNKSDFEQFASELGVDFYHRFAGDSQGALDEVNRLFNSKMESGGFEAGSKFMDQFTKRLDESKSGGISLDFQRAMKTSGVELGDLVGNGVVGGVGQAFKLLSALPPEVQAPIAVAGGAAGVVLVSALNGALLGAAGTIGLAAGIIAEAHDPQIQASFTNLSTDFTNVMENAGKSFRQPLDESIQILDTSLLGMSGTIASFEGKIAPATVALATGVAHAAEEITQGLDDAGNASEETLAAVGDAVGYLGSSVHVFMDEIAVGGKSGADSIRFLAAAVGTTLDMLGVLFITASMGWNTFKFGVESALLPMSLLLKGMEHFGIFGGTAKNILDGVNSVLGNTSSKSKDAKSSTDRLGDSLAATAHTAQQLADELNAVVDAEDKLIGKNLTAAGTGIQFRQSLDALNKSLQNNGHSFDLSTDAGLANADALNKAEKDALANAEAIRDQTTASQGAAAGADAYANALEGDTAALVGSMHQGHATQGQIADMIATMYGVPKDIATTFLTPGGVDAENLIAWIEANAVSKELYLRYHIFYQTSQQVPPGFGASDPGGGTWMGSIHGVRHAATGLLDAGVYSNGPILFAEPETGGEAMIPRLTPDEGRARMITEQAASWHGGHVVWGGGHGGPQPVGPVTTSSPLAPGSIAAELTTVLAGPLGQLAEAIHARRTVSVKVGGRELLRAHESAQRDSKWVG